MMKRRQVPGIILSIQAYLRYQLWLFPIMLIGVVFLAFENIQSNNFEFYEASINLRSIIKTAPIDRPDLAYEVYTKHIPMPIWTALTLPFFEHEIIEMSIPYSIFLFMLTWILYKMLKSISLQEPFVQENAKRFYWLAWILIGWDAFRLSRFIFIKYWVERTELPLQYMSMPGLDYFKVGILLFVAAWVYQRGLSISKDADGLV